MRWRTRSSWKSSIIRSKGTTAHSSMSTMLRSRAAAIITGGIS
jgi:hypothetical protein